MRSLFMKIFAIFWLAQSLIFIISTTLIVRQRFPSPNIVGDALDSNLIHTAALAMTAYETGGCSGFEKNSNRYEPAGAVLLDQRGEMVCRTPNAYSFSEAVPLSSRRVDGRQIDGRNVWLVPVKSSTGERYQYAWFQEPSSSQAPLRHSPLLRFAFPQLPVAIAVGGLTTFALVLLFTRPLVRLRKAARQLAEGDLSTRVETISKKGSLAQSDEFQGLVHDFNHMADRLESLVGAQRMLLRDVSHELRSPLSRLSVALELAREDAGPESEQHLTRIEREADNLNRLIGQLLTLSSMETNERNSMFKHVSLNEICKQIIPDAEYEAQQRFCTIILKEEGQCIISGDPELLYRAIENVVRNAIRYTDPGTQVEVRVAAKAIDGEKFAIVKVIDEGPGIPETELPHIFRPFYRVDRARSSSTGGFGVGLAITERAVTLHGGSLRAANRKERGTSIEITFPLDRQG